MNRDTYFTEITQDVTIEARFNETMLNSVLISEIVKNIGFKVFSNAIAIGGSVKCIVVKNGNKSIL